MSAPPTRAAAAPSFRATTGTVTDRLRATRWVRHPHAGAFCLFSLIIGSTYWPVLDGTRSLVTNGPWLNPVFVLDALGGGPIPAPLTRLVAASWLHLRLPVVDPFQGFGIPLLSNQSVAVYPPQVIAHLIFPGNYSIWLVVNLVGLAFGVYLLCRAFGLGFSGAMAAGLLAALAGVVPPNVNNAAPNTLAVLPFVVVAVRYAVDPVSEHRRVAMLGIATSVALLCLSGFQELLPLMVIVIAVYAVALVLHYGTWRARPRLIAGAVGSALAGAAIGSIGIIPTLSVVNAGTSVNTASEHLTHAPTYWLSTLTLPTITGHAMNGAPEGLGDAVYILGTPLLVLVVVLALLVALRRGGEHTRWYVFPSIAFVVFGVLGYADIGHVLQLMGIPLFDKISSIRYLQFAWWVPLCVLLGAVISNARVLAWKDALIGLVIAGAFDAYFYVRLRQALTASHVASDSNVTHAPLVAAAVLLVFVAAVLSVRWLGWGLASLLMAVVVLVSCIYDLPTNFAPARQDRAVATVKVPDSMGSVGDQLALFGILRQQLPTQQYSVQLWGPLVPKAYRATLSRLFSKTQTSGLGPFDVATPTLSALTVTPRAVSVLRSLGVDFLVLASPLSGPGFTSIPSCGDGTSKPEGVLCSLGEVPSSTQSVGFSPRDFFVYRVIGADPLVQPTATPVPVASTEVAIRKVSSKLSTSVSGLSTDAYVTTSAAHLRAARGVRGVSRHANTQEVSITAHSSSSGVVVLRESYEPGLRATVDGRATAAMPVDGGLWTAVDVGSGTSDVVLEYTTTADVVEFGFSAAGLALLALLWMALGASEWRLPRRWARARHRPGSSQRGD